MIEQNKDSLPVGVPDGFRVMKPTGAILRDGERWEIYAPCGSGGIVHEDDVTDWVVRQLLDAMIAAPTVKAEQVQAPSLPAAVSAEAQGCEARESIEEAASILRNMIDSIGVHGNYSQESTLLFLNQALSSIAALSAQQSAHVSVPTELLGRAMYAKDGRELIEANRELRALLNGGEA